MITVFFNEDGYCIAGENIEVTRRCSPAVTSRGDRVFQAAHHTYKVLYLALCEIKDLKIQEDVMVYNDSRIIDEVNRTLEPIDSSCQQWLNILHRYTIPAIKAVVFFRKKSPDQIKATVSSTQNKMLPSLDAKTRQDIIQEEQQRLKSKAQKRQRNIIKSFKQTWFGDNNEY